MNLSDYIITLMIFNSIKYKLKVPDENAMTNRLSHHTIESQQYEALLHRILLF